MSALEQLLEDFRSKTHIKKSRKRPRDSTHAEKRYVHERTTKICPEMRKQSEDDIVIDVKTEK
jgi:hypothetical protein